MTGHELKVQRVTVGLKQIDLAARTGIPRERLSRFENGWQDLRPDELRRVREALDQVRQNPQNRTPAVAAGDAVPAQTLCTTEDH